MSCPRDQVVNPASETPSSVFRSLERPVPFRYIIVSFWQAISTFLSSITLSGFFRIAGIVHFYPCFTSDEWPKLEFNKAMRYPGLPLDYSFWKQYLIRSDSPQSADASRNEVRGLERLNGSGLWADGPFRAISSEFPAHAGLHIEQKPGDSVSRPIGGALCPGLASQVAWSHRRASELLLQSLHRNPVWAVHFLPPAAGMLASGLNPQKFH